MKKYFAVETKCGHVRKTNCIWIKFAVYADNAKDAVKQVREYGRVKRNHLDFVRDVEEISFDEFISLRAQNDADKYLHCKNIQEQRQIENFEERVEIDEYNIAKKNKKTTKKESLDYRKKQIEIKEKSNKRYLIECLTMEVVA